jgi:hypothetical protein
MRMTGKCKLAGTPSQLLHVSSTLIARHEAFQKPGVLTAYDTDLKPLWTNDLRMDAIGALVHDGLCWVLDRAGLSAYRPATGECLNRIELPLPSNMQAGGATTVSNGFVVAIEHGEGHPPAPPSMLRIDVNGAVRWSTELSMEGVFLEGHEIDVQDGSRTGRVQRDNVDSWRCSYFTAGMMVASPSMVLGHFFDMPRSGIGMVYIVGLEDGSLRYRSPMVPIHHVMATTSGDFLIGLHGYGAFATWRCWPDVGVVDEWSSSGRCVEDRGDIRVLEMRNTGEPQHVARLHAGGEATRGSLLPGFDTQSVPHLMDDGSLLYYRRGSLYVVRDLTVVDQVSLAEGKRPDLATNLQVVGGCAFIGLTYWDRGDVFRGTGSLVRVEL